MYRQKMLIVVGLALAILAWGASPGEAVTTMPTNTWGAPDYYATPNWAFSPPIRKFIDGLPGLTSAATNSLGQYIPVAVADQFTYPGTDYYEIGLREYSQKMHTDLPPTKLRGYYQINTGATTTGAPLTTDHSNQYLGPLIIAQKDRPVRIKFVNELTPGSSLFVPVDTTIMGSGPFEINYDPVTKLATGTTNSGMFSQNRATLHLHGGRTPWISDGTPHQWITPAGEPTTYPKGVSVSNVPDMWYDSGNVLPNGSYAVIASCAGQTTCGVAGATTDPGPGAQTFYWTNQQSGRLMFYHDHAWGITRLNVYVGEAAGYLIQDPTELALIAAGTIPSVQIPLVVQDKTYVDEATITATDPTWNWGSVPGSAVTGDLWWPHVYMPAQNPFNPNMSGINDFGRWHYGPWFFPGTPLCGSVPDAVKPYCIEFGPVANPRYDAACVPSAGNNFFCQPPLNPGTPNPSWGAEAFLDTMIVNGTAYPVLNVDPQEYRFRVLNASHDRFINLQFYVADPLQTNPTCTGCAANTEVRMVAAGPRPLCSATLTTNCTCDPAGGFEPAGCFPDTWPQDGREGGVPDPGMRGPAWIQIGTEGGFLPEPVLLPNRPVAWNLDPTMFNVGNVLNWNDGGGTLTLGPAERADVIVDFTQYAGQTLIMYNDAPTAFPALDPHYDYYTGAPDRTDIGANWAIPVGLGPNIRTVMQIIVSGTAGTVVPVDAYNPARLAALQAAFTPAGGNGVFVQSQHPVIVGQTAYNNTYNTTFPATWPNWGVSRISDNYISFMQPDGTIVSNLHMEAKAIHDEMGATFDDYGRMSAKLGLETPFTNAAISNFILQNYVDPPTEFVRPGQIQVWKITHNGVDTHPIHFHLFEVQLLNRVGWDGFIRLPDLNELGWKDTLRIAPLEDTIVAVRPVLPQVPFALPESVRPLNPEQPIGSMMGFSMIDPQTGADIVPPTTNIMYNFGFEYVWHCHILSHEENDMMRSIVFKVKDNLGVASGTNWYLDTNSNRTWNGPSADRLITFTAPVADAIRVSGDWNGNGITSAGAFKAGVWYLDLNGNGIWDGATIDGQFTFGGGIAGAVPVTGDWNGSGSTKLGVYANGKWYLDRNGNKAWNGTPTDTLYNFGGGIAGAVPVTGDWNGSGTTKLGIYANGRWYLDLNGNGAWNGTPTDALYSFGGGIAGAVPVTGDWAGNGTTKIGVFANGKWYLDLNGNGVWNASPTDALYNFGGGLPGVVPVAGLW